MSRFTIALLSDEATAGEEVESSSDAAIDEIVESPESDISDAAEIATELDQADAAIDEGSDTAEALSGIQEKLEESVETGGIDPIAAEAIKIAVEHMSARVGLKDSHSGIAIEGFKSKTTRVQATRIAIESIGEQIKKIWQHIVNAFNTAIEWVKKFFMKLFDGATKLKNRAVKLKAAAKEKAGKKIPAGETISNDGLAESLRLDGKLPDPGAVASDIAQCTEVIFGKDAVAKKAAEISANAETVLSTVEESERFKTALGVFSRILPDLGKSYKIDGLAEGLKATCSDNMAGDKVLVVVTLADSVDTDGIMKHIGGVKVMMANAEGRKPLIKTDMVPMTPEQAGKTAEGVEKIADALLSAKGSLDKMSEAQKKLQAYAKKLANNTKGDAAKNTNTAAKVAKVAMSISSSGMAASHQFVMGLGNSALNYAAASLALAGKEEKKEEKKA
jgi:phiKZ-like phage internal head proteins